MVPSGEIVIGAGDSSPFSRGPVVAGVGAAGVAEALASSSARSF
jgi:hypothetical protein